MTCKISLFKSIRETIKHHIASVFISCVAFFIQFIVFFLEIQNYSFENALNLEPSLITERILEITTPSGAYAVPIVLIAIILAFDFFRYLHSKKQVDFYDSLPMTRQNWFALRTLSAFLIFIIPYLIFTLLEMLLLLVLGFTEIGFFINLLWNAVCMILIFSVTWFTGALAMIMTGHPVTAFCGFCVFCGYAPILLRYLYPVYAEAYFDSFVADTSSLYYLNYLSPIGLAYKLLNSSHLGWIANEHLTDFIFIFVITLLVAGLTYVLYLKRPSEASQRAMTFEKFNPVIRILLVIPATLYLGIYLSQVASYGSIVWMIFGFVIGTVLLHGIIESIFQFDIRGLWAYKKQMIGCFAATLLFACIFWFDLIQYDAYVPELDQVEKISIQLNNYYYDAEENDGISGEYLDDALLLATNLVKQDNHVDSADVESVTFTYHLKNGSIKQRQYYMHFDTNQELMDTLYATKEFKNDICQLYQEDWSTIAYIEWDDSINRIPLYMSDAQLEQLFETYLAEYTPVTYSQIRDEVPIGSFVLRFDKSDAYHGYSCDVYASFTQTISLLNNFIASNVDISKYGEITESILDKYTIRQLEFYMEGEPLTITDSEVIQELKEHLILSEFFYKNNNHFDWENYYDVGISLNTDSGVEYTSAVIERKIVDKIIR